MAVMRGVSYPEAYSNSGTVEGAVYWGPSERDGDVAHSLSHASGPHGKSNVSYR